MAAKRPIVPEGNTPGKTASKRPSTQGTSRKSLFQESDRIKSASGIQKWTDEETIALVQYICLYSENAWTDKWPTGKDPEFWIACSESVNKACKSSRTGGSCRTRVTKFLAREFKTLSEAEEALQIDYVRSSVAFEERSIFEERARSTPKKTVLVDDACLSPIFSCSPSKGAEQSVGDVVRQFLMYFKSSMSSRLRTQLLQHIFKLSVLQEHGIDFFKFMNSDFLNVSLGAMKTLFTEKKHNLIYDLSRCFNGLTTR